MWYITMWWHYNLFVFSPDGKKENLKMNSATHVFYIMFVINIRVTYYIIITTV